MQAGPQQDAAPKRAPMVGDHLAMDLLNTEARDGEQLIEYWNSDDDVLGWLRQHGVAPVPWSGTREDVDLLAHARALRMLSRRLISECMQNEAADISALNAYLHAYRSAPHLERDEHGHWLLTRVTQSDVTASLLGQVAEAVAQLLTEDNLGLVKQCEHPDCILWFYDRTKAHTRRWCSMAVCGNRHKAAQFRKRSVNEAG